jgi:hypothetical protein
MIRRKLGRPQWPRYQPPTVAPIWFALCAAMTT